MRKNKTFEVNILSEQSSYTQSENATFYTSDTEAYLNFKPNDEFKFDSATIALLNKDDQSLVSTPMVVADGIAQYEIPPNVIAHFGKWSAQVIFTNQSENYTSRLINFEVERYLTDSRPPKLEDVENINILISEANELIQQLKNIGVSEHISNKSNPHSVTKAQVGLGSVQNYGIATQIEAQSGTSGAKYMTPQRTKEAIETLGVRKYSANIGDGTAKTFTINHGLNTTDVSISTYLDNEEILPAMRKVINANSVQLDFATVWGTNKIKVVVRG